MMYYVVLYIYIVDSYLLSLRFLLLVPLHATQQFLSCLSNKNIFRNHILFSITKKKLVSSEKRLLLYINKENDLRVARAQKERWKKNLANIKKIGIGDHSYGS